jgi:uncharacterized membrane protein
VKKTLKWFAAAVLFTLLAIPSYVTADMPEPPCPTCPPGYAIT